MTANEGFQNPLRSIVQVPKVDSFFPQTDFLHAGYGSQDKYQ